ncbi:MAG: FGGY family carbohydrate kinase [Chloroflexota bacterium]|nr:FGGY family carbohydrate kinase [Chloroflexota bacterium]MDE2949069.1 FGGY family carbohydrate kinase [Chloroflexota bacterium]
MSSFLIGIDVGSSACKCTIVDDSLRPVSQNAQPYPTRHPQYAAAEQDPEDWYRSACEAVRNCLDSGGIRPANVMGISIAGPAHSVALLDGAGEILHPTIHWSDLRSAPQAERLETNCGDAIFAATLCRVNPAWTLPQLLWLQENRPAVYRRLRHILVVKDYVRYRLTGLYETDEYDAIGTQLYDVHAGAWSPALLEIVDLAKEMLPQVRPATDISGELTENAARDCGLLKGTPVAVGSGDSVVEAAGIGAIVPGHCVLKLGTAANVNLVMRDAKPSPGAILYRHVVDPHWFAITATNSGTSTLQWFAETFCRAATEHPAGQPAYKQVESLAADSVPGARGLLFHPYLQGERSPYWDPHLRGDFVGIHRRHRLEDFARAILEGVAYSLRDCFELVSDFGESISELYLLGGGAKSQLWSQLICDVLGRPMVKPAEQSAAYGSAILAGIATGLFDDWVDARRVRTLPAEVLQPADESRQLYDGNFEAYQAVVQALRPHVRSLEEIAAREEQ